MHSIPCVIFAGGKSSRMGEDKALLPFGKYSTLTEYQLKKLKKIFSHVYISSKSSIQFPFDAQFILDIKSEDVYAPTLGFVSIFQNLEVDSFFAISVDTPFISKEIIQELILQDKPSFDATIARLHSRMQPLCGIYHRCLEAKFQQTLVDGNHKLGYLLKNSNTNYIDFDDEVNFLNLNNKDEYKKALTLV